MAYLTPEDVAEVWGVSANHVRTLCRRGELAAMKTGTGAHASWRIRPEAVADFEGRHSQQTESAPELVTHGHTIDVATGLPAGATYAPVFGGAVPWRHEVIEDRPTAGRGQRTRKSASLG